MSLSACVPHALVLIASSLILRFQQTWMLIAGGIAIALVAGMCGFVTAMRRNPRFNQRVRSTALFLPITKSHNTFLRSSLALPALGNEYDELVKGVDSSRYSSTGLDSSRGPLSF
jgi:hypothetical protein